MAKRKQDTNGGIDIPQHAPTVDDHLAGIQAYEAIKAENETLREAQAAQAKHQDEMIDMLVEMREQMDALKAGHAAPVAVADPLAAAQAALDREKEALLEEFKDLPNIDVIEHRITHGSDAPSAIRLKAAPGGIPEPTVQEDPHGETCHWKLRWFNFAIPGRAERFASEGYQKVMKEELQDPDSIPNMAEGPQVKKGERGLEVLGKIPRKIYEFKKKRDAIRQGRLMTSESGLRDHLSNRVASMAGMTGGNADQAGSTVHGKFNLKITQGETERVTA